MATQIALSDEQRDEILRLHAPHVPTHSRRAPAPAVVSAPTGIAGLLGIPLRVRFKGDRDATDTSGPPSPKAGTLINSGIVTTGIYRSAFPSALNLEHLRSLKLRTVVTLVETEFNPDVTKFFKDANIKHYRIPVPAHKDGNNMAVEDIAQVLRIMTNPCNFPILVHCNKGKHRTGCIIAAFRILAAHNERTDWTSPKCSPLSEYRAYALQKARSLDEAFIASFSARKIMHAIADIEHPVKPINYSAPLPPSPPLSGEVSPEERAAMHSKYMQRSLYLHHDDRGDDCWDSGCWDGEISNAICASGEMCPNWVEHERIAAADDL